MRVFDMDPISLSVELWWAIGIAITIWALAPVYARYIRNKIIASDIRTAPQNASRLAMAGVIKLVAAAASSAGLAAVVFSWVLGWRLSAQNSDQQGIEKVVWLRDVLEAYVDFIQQTSLGAWVISLVILALIWLVASRSGSRKRWEKAIDARKQALLAKYSGVIGEELRRQAEISNRELVAEIDKRVNDTEQYNATLLESYDHLPVVEFGNDSNRKASLEDLRELRRSILEPAPDEENEGETQKAIENIDVLIADIEGSLTVPFLKLDGTTRSTPFINAVANLAVDAEDIDRQLRESLVEYEVKNHNVESSTKARREPELLHEWITAGATSEATVKGTSKIGQYSARVVLTTIFMGFVSMASANVGHSLIVYAKDVELGLTLSMGTHEIEKTLAGSSEPPLAPSEPVKEEELAPDDVTVEYLRQSFRAAAALSLQHSFAIQSSPRMGRQLFELAAVEARSKVLHASERKAAPSLDTGRGPHSFIAHEGSVPHHERLVMDSIDEPMNRRIETLRRNGSAWRRVRAAAARPASADFAREAFLRTALASDDLYSRHTIRSWANHAANDFVNDIASGVDPADARVRTSMSADTHFFSARDRRVVGDFHASAPQKFDAKINAYRSGFSDPGSIHRTAPGFSGGATGRVGSHYANLFPSVTPPSSYGGPRAVGGGRGGVTGRSFGRIRFSGRVGGVVIGREPEAGGVELDIVGLDWRVVDSGVHLTLQTADGTKTAIGTFHSAIVHHAMAYAADGRVVTTTLPLPRTNRNGDIEINARRVVVHPAFEDTAFACPVIQVDRFVDGFTINDKAGARATKIQNARQAVTIFGRLLSYLGQLPPNQRDVNEEGIDTIMQTLTSYLRECTDVKTCLPIEYYEELGFKFDADRLVQCVVSSTDWLKCKALVESMTPQTFYAVDSGVREAAFSLDTDFDFLTGVNATDLLWPLEFVIHAVPQSMEGMDLSVEEGWDPWQFPGIKADIQKVVAQGIASSSNAQRVFSQMREFVVLQRLFRLALDGQLGMRFPLDALVQLQKYTFPAVKVQRHERWNVNQPWLQMMYEHKLGFIEDLQEVTSSSMTSMECRSGALMALEKEESNPWPKSGASIWEFIVNFESHCPNHPSTFEIEQRRSLLRSEDLIDEAIYLTSMPRNSGAFYCAEL